MPDFRDHPTDGTQPRSFGDEPLRVALSTVDELVVLEVGGEVDMLTSPRLRAAVLDAVERTDGQPLALDLDGVTFLGTSGLAALVEAREAAARAGVPLRLVCSVPQVVRPLTIAGLLPLFDIRSTLDADDSEPTPSRNQTVI